MLPYTICASYTGILSAARNRPEHRPRKGRGGPPEAASASSYTLSFLHHPNAGNLATELNPVENVWEFLRANFLSHRVWDTYEAILDACQNAWNKLIEMPERIASLTRRTWAKPVTG